MDATNSNSPHLYHYPGIAQAGRINEALLPDFAHIDERMKADFLNFAAQYSDLIAFYNLKSDNPVGSWQQFFEKDKSVFLATVIKTDTKKFLLEEENILLQLSIEKNPRQKLKSLKSFFELILSMAQLITSWHQKARRLNESADGSPEGIELILENLIESRLYYDLNTLRDHFNHYRETNVDSAPTTRDISAPSANSYAYFQQELKGISIEMESKRGLKRRERKADQEVLGINNMAKRLQLIFQSFYTGIFQVIAGANRFLEISLKEKTNHSPDIGLFLAFTDLFSYLQEDLNGLTKKHLDYFYEEILSQKPKASHSDEVNIHLELNSLVDNHYLEQGTMLSAGKSVGGIESYYEVCDDIMLNQATISELKTIFISQSPLLGSDSSFRLVSNIFAAPIADSKDGKGLPLELNENWPTFGEDPLTNASGNLQMDFAEIGMAISSPVLLLSEGERNIKFQLAFSPESFITLNTLIANISENSSMSKENAFFMQFFNNLEFFASGEEEWIKLTHFHIDPILNTQQGKISITLTLQSSDPAIVSWHSDLPGEAFDTPWPVIQVKLSNTDTVYGYSFLRDLILDHINIEVEVKKVRQLDLFNEIGKLDNTKPFQPFGPTPSKGSYLLIGNTEIHKKDLTHLEIEAEWYDLPQDEEGFNGFYDPYELGITNEDFKVNISTLKQGSFFPEDKKDRQTFHLFTAHKEYPTENKEETTEKVPQFLQVPRPQKLSWKEASQPGDNRLKPFTKFKDVDLSPLDFQPNYELASTENYDPSVLSGFLRMELISPKYGFGHKEFPKIFTKVATENSVTSGRRHLNPFKIYRQKPLPPQPHIPVLHSLTLNYKAETKINLLKSGGNTKHSKSEGRLFHLYPFGVRKIHDPQNTFNRHLLPQFEADGFLFIGLQNIKTPQQLSLFFQMKESRSIRVLHSPPEITWHYLSNDSWMEFNAEDFISDSTNGFTTSGIINLDIPRDITNQNTIMAAGTHWIRISVDGNTDVIGRTISLKTQAVKAKWINNEDPEHLKTPLPAGMISRLETSVPEISAIHQPFTSFGGNPSERDARFYTRVSERLRHKNRAVTPWDIERMVLEKFPLIHQAKCLTHTAYPDWVTQPGTIRIVVAPDFSNFALHKEPKVSFSELQQVKEFIEAHISSFTNVEVRNPSYEKVKVMCNVVLHKGKNSGEYLNKLSREVNNYMVPWRENSSMTIDMGGSFSKDDIIRFIESLDFVDFVTAFSLVQVMEKEGKTHEDTQYKIYDTVRDPSNLATVQASTPWSVLIPTTQHAVSFIYDHDYRRPNLAGVNNMAIGTDFVVSDETEVDFAFEDFRRKLVENKNGDDNEEFTLTIDFS